MSDEDIRLAMVMWEAVSGEPVCTCNDAWLGHPNPHAATCRRFEISNDRLRAARAVNALPLTTNDT